MVSGWNCIKLNQREIPHLDNSQRLHNNKFTCRCKESDKHKEQTQKANEQTKIFNQITVFKFRNVSRVAVNFSRIHQSYRNLVVNARQVHD
jgi:hypothetical protein